MPRKSTDIVAAPVNILMMAPSGCGKTHFLGTVADAEKMYLITTERKLHTISDKVFDYDVADTWDEFLAHLTWFKQNYKELGYTALCIDSFSRLMFIYSRELEGNGTLEFEDHRKLLIHGAKICRGLTSGLDCHTVTVCIADETITKDGYVKLMPKLTGQLKGMINEFYDVIAIAKNDVDNEGNTKYWLQIQGDKVSSAKCELKHLDGQRNVEKNFKVFKRPTNTTQGE